MQKEGNEKEAEREGDGRPSTPKPLGQAGRPSWEPLDKPIKSGVRKGTLESAITEAGEWEMTVP